MCEIERCAFPSFSGESLRIDYLVTIYAELLDNRVERVEIPIQILPPYKRETPILPVQRLVDISSSWKVCEESKLYRSPQQKLANNETLSFADLTEYYNQHPYRKPRKGPSDQSMYEYLVENSVMSHFELKKETQHIAKLSISRTTIKAGETIIANLNFKDVDLTTFQFSAELEGFEEIGDSAVVSVKETGHQRISYTEHIVWLRDSCSFRLGSSSSRCPPSLEAGFVQRKYRVKLKLFVADPKASIGAEAAPAWLGSTPDSPFMEVFDLSFPINILPIK